MAGHVVRAGILPAANTIVALAGKRYGWPQVAGFRDDRGYSYANRVQLRADGTGVSSAYFRAADRHRDVTISPDGRRLFLVTDSFGMTLDASGQRSEVPAHPGAVLEFSYVSTERRDPQP